MSYDLPVLPRFRTLFLTVGGFFALAFLIYGWSLHNPFVRWDDGMLIYENPAIRAINPSSLKWIFTHFDPELYIPLTFFTYQIDYLIGGIQPFQYHLDNLVLHTLNALFIGWLMFLIFKRRWLAVFCGILFLVHPLHTEAVEWASARKDVLSTFFFLSSIIAYLYAGERKRSWIFWLSVGLFFLGLLSKVMIITLPIVLLLIDALMRRPMDRKMFIDKIPYFFLSILFGLIGVLGKQGVIASSSVSAKILMACKSVVFYIHQFFWPAKLSLLYPYAKAITITSPDFFVPMIIVVLLVAYGAFLWNRQRTIAVGIFFYLVTVGPTLINFAKGGDLDVYFASDRYAYIPSIGMIVVIGAVLMQLSEGRSQNAVKNILGAICTLSIIALSVLAYKQSLVWNDTRSLFENVIKLYPDSSHVAHNNLGNMYRLEGDLSSAIDEYKQALVIRPSAKAYTNLGAAYRKQKDYVDALDAYEKALTLDPQSEFAHFGLGIVEAEQGKFDEAEIEYTKAIGFDPTYEDVYINLGALYAAENKFQQAIEQYQKALAISPYNPSAEYNLAVAYDSLGNVDDAIAAYKQTIEFDPTMIAARINLALLLYNKKADRQGAIDQFHAILKLNPNNQSAIAALRQMGE